MPAGGSHRHAMQAVGKRCLKHRIAVCARASLGLAKQRGVLLAQGQIDRHQRIESGELARVGLDQTNMRHRAGDRLLCHAFPLALLLFLLSRFCRLPAHGRCRFCCNAASTCSVLRLARLRPYNLAQKLVIMATKSPIISISWVVSAVFTITSSRSCRASKVWMYATPKRDARPYAPRQCGQSLDWRATPETWGADHRCHCHTL